MEDKQILKNNEQIINENNNKNNTDLKPKQSFLSAGLDISKFSYRPNLINIPGFFANQGFPNMSITLFILITVSHLSMFLLAQSCCSTNNFNYSKLSNIFFIDYFFQIIVLLLKSLRIFFTINHIIKYSKNFVFNQEYLSVLVVSLLFLLILKLKNKIIKYNPYFTLASVVLTISIAFQSSIGKELTILKPRKSSLDDLSILCVWLSSHHDVPAVFKSCVTVKNCRLSIIMSHIYTIIAYFSIGVLGYIGFPDPEPIFVNSFNNPTSPLICLAYTIKIIRLCLILSNFTTGIAGNLRLENNKIFPVIMGLLMILSGTTVSSLNNIKLMGLLLSSSVMFLQPTLVYVKTNKMNLRNVTIALVNLSIGVFLITIGTLEIYSSYKPVKTKK
ncbi:hypothetical protein NUSPORA_02567 [Nucleospora cyclopteri]